MYINFLFNNIRMVGVVEVLSQNWNPSPLRSVGQYFSVLCKLVTETNVKDFPNFCSENT